MPKSAAAAVADPVETPATPLAEPTNVLDAIIEVTGAKDGPDDVPLVPVVGDAPADPAADPAAQPDGDAPTPEVATPANAGADPNAPPAGDAPLDEAAQAVEKEMETLGITKPDSQARFRELANEAKEGRVYRERYEQQEQVFQHLERSGVTGDHLGMLSNYVSGITSGNPVQMRQAFELLKSEVVAAAELLGEEVPGLVDPLAAHADLAERVRENQLERADALEIARSRKTSQLVTQHQTTTAEATRAQTALVEGRNALNALEVELKAKDPQYQAKREILVSTLQPVFAQLPPARWAEAFATAYANLRLPAAAAPASSVRPDPANSQRPKGTAGTPQAKTALDAVLQGLGLSPEA